MLLWRLESACNACNVLQEHAIGSVPIFPVNAPCSTRPSFPLLHFLHTPHTSHLTPYTSHLSHPHIPYSFCSPRQANKNDFAQLEIDCLDSLVLDVAPRIPVFSPYQQPQRPQTTSRRGVLPPIPAKSYLSSPLTSLSSATHRTCSPLSTLISRSDERSATCAHARGSKGKPDLSF